MLSICIKGILKTQLVRYSIYIILITFINAMAGPRSIMACSNQKNHGATHFICGRSFNAGPGSNSSGVDFYTPYEARDFVMSHQNELNIDILSFEMMVYLERIKTLYTNIKSKRN